MKLEQVKLQMWNYPVTANQFIHSDALDIAGVLIYIKDEFSG